MDHFTAKATVGVRHLKPHDYSRHDYSKLFIQKNLIPSGSNSGDFTVITR